MLSLLPLLLGIAALTAIGCAALQDVRERLIANRYSVILLFLGALHHAAIATTPADWLGSTGLALATAATLFVVCFLLWRLGGLGGGDVKLLVAAAFFVGPGGVAMLLLATVLAGGALALAQLIVAAAAPLLSTVIPLPATSAAAAGRRSIPYGVAIAAGAACAIVPSLPTVIG